MTKRKTFIEIASTISIASEIILNSISQSTKQLQKIHGTQHLLHGCYFISF